MTNSQLATLICGKIPSYIVSFIGMYLIANFNESGIKLLIGICLFHLGCDMYHYFTDHFKPKE